MKMTSQAVLHGIKQSKGDYEGRAFDSTTYHLSVDIGTSSSGESIGVVTRPFKCGDSTEFQKWASFKTKWPLGGVLCDCDFDIVAGSENSSKLTLLAIKPASTAKAA